MSRQQPRTRASNRRCPSAACTTDAPTDAPTVAAAAGPSYSPPPFEGVRSGKYTYVEYATGDKALYDHDADPQQVNNLAAAAASATVMSQLAGAIHALHSCTGAACRTAEQATMP